MKRIAFLTINLASGMIVAVAAGTEPKLSPTMVTNLVESSKTSFREFQQTQRIDHIFDKRRLDDTESMTCEHSLLNCIKNEKCAACFKALGEKSIDFTALARGTTCDEVIDPIVEKGICAKDIKSDKTGFGAFCESVNSCAVKEKDDILYYDDDVDDDDDDDSNTTKLDCDTLTECKWDGFKASYIGDGACQSWGCYNTAICNYDGGDCCEDTCKKNENDLVKCGSDGYVCLDPKSKDAVEKDKDKIEKKCKDNEIGVQLLKFASFGDGWGKTSMTIAPKGSTKSKPTYEGTMKDGATSKELMCLPNESACYDVKLSGGIWGNRVSWQIKPLKEGGPDIASGGAPLQCQFPMGGNDCESTCNGQSDTDSKAGAGDGDDSYHSYEAMQKCIESTCLIQVASCELSLTCNSCLLVERSYCYSDPSFAALVKCTLCNCVPEAGKEDEDNFEAFCAEDERDGDGEQMPECTAENSKEGIFALFNYTVCSNIDFETVSIKTNYDNDHFGRLDSFENCVNTYTKEEYHGGNTALGCMRILQEAILDPTEEDSKTDPSGTIAKMAYHLYEDAETFCDCSARTSAACPACKGFANFKTLLYESLDACRALDLIDCAAWSEFSAPCQKNMETKFGKSTFSDKAQCKYVLDGCGGVGPFPSFRHFDCESESGDKEAWNFYETFAKGCLEGDTSGSGKKGVKPIKPYKPPELPKTTAAPTRRYVPYGNDDDKSVPLEPKANESSGSASDDRKSKGSKFKSFMKFLLFCILCGGAYWYYKRTREFDYVRFRRARNYGAESGMLDGSGMENSATSFEPPSLPPPPSSFQVSNNFA